MIPGRRLAAAWIALTLLAAACGPAGRGPTYPPIGATAPPVGEATAATQARVVAALTAAGLPASVATRPYRPPEAARLAAAPRTVLDVALAQDPQGGQVVIYALGSSEAARAAAAEQAAYVASGPGGIQFPPDSRFVLRVLGSTVVFFTWAPGASPDPRTADLAAALETIGTGVPVPG